LAAGGREKCADLVEKTAHMLCDLLYEDKWRYWYFDGAKPHPSGRGVKRRSVSTLSKPRALD
jgi:hypothetical protein